MCYSEAMPLEMSQVSQEDCSRGNLETFNIVAFIHSFQTREGDQLEQLKHVLRLCDLQAVWREVCLHH